MDNALSAVCRMINVAPAFIPIGQVLPFVLAALPLRGDTSEGPQVYGCLSTLLTQSEPTAVSMVGPILMATFEVLSPHSTAIDETKLVCGALLKYVAGSNLQAQLVACLQQVSDPAVRQEIDLAISS